MTTDRTADRSDSGQWLTYAAAGELLRLSPDAVRQRAKRGKWRRMPGNDGRVLVLVPPGADEQPTERNHSAIAALADAVSVLREELARMHVLLAAAEQRAERRWWLHRLWRRLFNRPP